MMRCYFIILCIGLNACAKKNMVKAEAAPPASAEIYIEKFQNGEEPEQWEMFINQDEGEDLKRTLDRMKRDSVYSNQMMRKIEGL